MNRLVHIVQSVEGALTNWKKTDWDHVAKENNTTPEVVMEYFERCKSRGVKFIPIGDPCEGFTSDRGCPGHEVKDES